MAIRLVLADDHPLILSGLTNLFDFESDMEVLATCADGAEALNAIRLCSPDAAILDIRMPAMSGLEVARKVHEENLSTRLILIAASLDDGEMLEAVGLGVHGLILKEMAPQLIVQCIRKVHAGDHWMERHTTKRALEKLLYREAGAREIAALLTPREIELVRLVAGGQRNRELADKLCISEGTVKVHLHNIYEKLGVNGRMALLRYAQEKGLA